MLRIMWSEHDSSDPVDPPDSVTLNGSEYYLDSFDSAESIAYYSPSDSAERND